MKRSRWDTPSPPVPVAKQQPPPWTYVSQLPQQQMGMNNPQFQHQQCSKGRGQQFGKGRGQQFGKGRGQQFGKGRGQQQEFGKGRGKKKKNKKANAGK